MKQFFVSLLEAYWPWVAIAVTLAFAAWSYLRSKCEGKEDFTLVELFALLGCIAAGVSFYMQLPSWLLAGMGAFGLFLAGLALGWLVYHVPRWYDFFYSQWCYQKGQRMSRWNERRRLERLKKAS